MIEFEGVSLPDFACFLDVAAALLPVSEETSLWFWHFVICVDVSRQDRSEVVMKHARELLAAMPSSTASPELELELAKRFPNCAVAAILSDWRISLERMMELAGDREACLWRGNSE